MNEHEPAEDEEEKEDSDDGIILFYIREGQS